MSKIRSFFATALFSCLVAGAAQAGSCPANKMTADGMGQKMSTTPAQGVTDMVISSSDLAQQSVGINDRLFRLRRLIVQPGGVVPWHSHADRPAIIYIISGQITEYASTCTVPIVHNAGEATAEMHATSHWWKNNSKHSVELLSADLFHKTMPDDHMM